MGEGKKGGGKGGGGVGVGEGTKKSEISKRVFSLKMLLFNKFFLILKILNFIFV